MRQGQMCRNLFCLYGKCAAGRQPASVRVERRQDRRRTTLIRSIWLPQGLALTQPPVWPAGQCVGDRYPGDVLHDQEVDALLGVEVVDGGDVTRRLRSLPLVRHAPARRSLTATPFSSPPSVIPGPRRGTRNPVRMTAGDPGYHPSAAAALGTPDTTPARLPRWGPRLSPA